MPVFQRCKKDFKYMAIKGTSRNPLHAAMQKKGATPKQISSGTFWEKTVEWEYVRNYLAKADFGAPLAGTEEALGDAAIGFATAKWCLIEFKRVQASVLAEKDKYPVFNEKNFEVDGKISAKYRDMESAFVDLLNTYGLPGKAVPPHFLVYGAGKKRNKVERKSKDEILKKLQLEFGACKSNSKEAEEFEKAISNYVTAAETYDLMEISANRYWYDWAKYSNVAPIAASAAAIKFDDFEKYSVSYVEFGDYVVKLAAAKGSNADVGGWALDVVLGTTVQGEKIVTTVADFALIADLQLELEPKHTPHNSRTATPKL